MFPTWKWSGGWDKRIEAGLLIWIHGTFYYLEHYGRVLWFFYSLCELFEGNDYILLNIISIEHRSMPDTMMWTSLLFVHWIHEWVVFSPVKAEERRVWVEEGAESQSLRVCGTFEERGSICLWLELDLKEESDKGEGWRAGLGHAWPCQLW